MSSATVRQPLELLDLPNEVLSHILKFCDSVAPSLIRSHGEPVRPWISPEPATTFKKVSVLSRRFHMLALPFLFRHLHVTLDRLHRIVAFTCSNGLDPHITTAQIYLAGPSTHRQPFWWSTLLSQYTRLCTLTLSGPPHVFAEIVNQPIKLSDQWAFKMPFQTVQLSHDSSFSMPAPDHTSSLLTARPWTSFLVNEGSSLLAYTTYEYFLRSTPSPILPQPSPNALHLYHNLTHFKYIAIFPTYNHVAEIMDVASDHMPNLESFSIKLLPDPASTILQTTLELSGFHFDVNDPWNEFETSLTLVAAAAVAMSQSREGHGGKLRQLRIDDVQMEGVRDTIESTVTPLLSVHPSLGWGYEGGGLWRRHQGSMAGAGS